MKVFALIDTDIIGGPGKGLFQLVASGKKLSLEFQLANFSYPSSHSAEFFREAERRGLSVQRILMRSSFDLRALAQVEQGLRMFSPDILQSHGYKSHCIAWLLHRKLGIPWVAVSHGWTSESFRMKLYRLFDLFLLRFPDASIAVSKPLFQTIQKQRRGKAHFLIENAVDIPETVNSSGGGEGRRKLGFREEDFVIGVFGRLSPEKGHKFLLRAMQKIEDPRIRLLIVGGGILEQELKTFVQDEGLSSRCLFLPYTEDLQQYYQVIDLLVLPSLSEGLPNVLLEAMALGKVVLGTKVGAIPDLIEDGVTGYLCLPGNAEQLAHRLQEIFSQRALPSEIGARARASLWPRFSPLERAKKFLAVYQQVTRSEHS